MHWRSTQPEHANELPVRPLGHTPALLYREHRRGSDRRERLTESGDWQAIWRIDGHSIRIIALSSASDASVPLPFPSAHPPDLADMREWFPQLSLLWDAIRHEYWRRFLPS
ncbi:hypothetical protein [Nocardia testacea]|uniref:hypothetical protein n=1 Tax=Nocardia testacea TaxID=248551 RepID=UPI003A884A87